MNENGERVNETPWCFFSFSAEAGCHGHGWTEYTSIVYLNRIGKISSNRSDKHADKGVAYDSYPFSYRLENGLVHFQKSSGTYAVK